MTCGRAAEACDLPPNAHLAEAGSVELGLDDLERLAELSAMTALVFIELPPGATGPSA